MVWIVFVAIALALLIVFIILIVFELKKNRGSISRALKFLSFTPVNERRGIQGENFVNYFLKDLINEDEYLLTNILLPLRNGHKTEIDSVLISRKGIFCIEIKNWVGHISGDNQSDY